VNKWVATVPSTFQWYLRSGPHTWTHDDRTPVLKFALPNDLFLHQCWWATPTTSEGSLSDVIACSSTVYGLYLPNLWLWTHQLIIMLAVSLTAIPTAILLYYFVLPQSPKDKDNNGHIGMRRATIAKTLLAHVVAWGLLIPFWIVAPGWIMDAWGVTNLVIRFSLVVVTPTESIFRILESLYGSTPHPSVTTTSLSAFVFYFCSPILLRRRKAVAPGKAAAPISNGHAANGSGEKQLSTTKFISTTTRIGNADLLRQLGHLVKYLFLTGATMSLLLLASDEQWPKYGLGPASTPVGLYKWSSLWNVQLWKVNLQYALLFQLILSTFGEGLIFATMLLTGLEAEAFADNPLGQTTSPSDFWGRRWNRLIHECLKNGVYKPVRFVGGGPRWLAISATFVASAMFHEWLLPNVFYNYPNTHGITTVFFLWQAMLVAVEAGTVGLPSRTVVATAGSSKPQNRRWWWSLAKPLQTALVIGLGLPPAHWFMDSYIRSNLFVHMHVLLPMILVESAIPATVV
jgi:Membrane bound O-acyl transferase family